MNTRTLIAVILTLGSLTAVAEQRGAKAIFVDTTSGAIVPGSAPQTNGKARTQKERHREKTAPRTPEAIGLMYYIELVSPSGQTSRVTADRTFRSGERILLHVRSSVDGDVEVFQREPDGRQTRLFPDERVNGGSAFIRKNVDTVLPAPSAWFRFDDQAGIERLIVVLTPRATSAPSRPAPPVQTVALERIESGAGSKGLLLETESTGPEQATYVVLPPQDGRGAEQIVVPIALKHQ
jgi:hypothetical protein